MSELDKDWILDKSGDAPPPDTETLDDWLIPVTEPVATTDADEESEVDVEEDDDEEPGPDPDELLRKARFMLEMDRPKDALKALQDLVDWHPDHHEGWCEVARCFHSLTDKDRALRAAELAIEADPYSAGGYEWKCRIQLYAEEWKEVLATAQHGCEMTYGDFEVERWKLRAWLAGGQKVEARQYLDEHPDLPDVAEVACGRGELARLAEDYPTADLEFRRAIDHDGARSEPWAGLSSVLLHQQRHDDAVTCVHRAMQLEPARPEIANRTVEIVDAWLGKRFSSLSKPAIAVMLISIFCTPGLSTFLLFPVALVWFLATRPIDRNRREKALSVLPRDLKDYYVTHQARSVRGAWAGFGCLIGILLGLAGGIAVLAALFTNFGWQGASRVLLLVGVGACFLIWKFVIDTPDKQPEVRFRFPGDPWVYEASEDEDETSDQHQPIPEWEPDPVWAAWQLLREGNAASAREKARSILSGNAENVDALVLFSAASLQMGEFEPGLTAAKSACSHDPEEYRAKTLVWANLAADGKLEEAVASAEEDPDAADSTGDYLIWLIRLQFNAGSAKTARALSELVQRLYPGSSEPHEVEGEWAFESGRYKEAEAAYRRALALNPESSSLHSSLAWTLERRLRFRAALESARRALQIDAQEEGAKTVLDRQITLSLMLFGSVLSLLLSLAAAVPTMLGSTTNHWIVAASVLGPAVTSILVFMLVKPWVRKLAPGLMLEMGAWESMDPRMISFMAAYPSFTLALTVHTAQAWSEIAMHRELMSARWPGAATVSVFVLLLWIGIVKLIAMLRSED